MRRLATCIVAHQLLLPELFSHNSTPLLFPRKLLLSGGSSCLKSLILFFFSSRRRHTRSLRDWSSDVCSSDLLIDGHNDIPDAIHERGGLDSVNFGVSQPRLMTDVPRLRAGHVSGQFWAAYVPVTTMDSGSHPAVYALEQIDLVRRLCARNSRSMAMAYTAADVQRNFAAGKVSCLIGI